MKRALRIDKVRLAALESVLRLYVNPERLARELPTLRLLCHRQAYIRAQAARVLSAVAATVRGHASATVIDCMSQVGSGALPVDTLHSAGIAMKPAVKHRGRAVERLAQAFRDLPSPVLGRISDGVFRLDLRCLEDEDAFVAQSKLLAFGLATR